MLKIRLKTLEGYGNGGGGYDAYGSGGGGGHGGGQGGGYDQGMDCYESDISS